MTDIQFLLLLMVLSLIAVKPANKEVDDFPRLLTAILFLFFTVIALMFEVSNLPNPSS